ncbi:uncharacterized protein LOC100903374 [Galendromus occidentalis]|uniref:Uncharacterized protein LOC100903374 n=1 Tax=Galendromus occidentalis TaxID=34638 RepID=A0AAJ6VZJ8_9ACAR|nr:uncharacterized protein LOC100903374 [Galendromus occidentalis]
MSSSRLTRLRLVHVQLQQNSEKRDLEEKVEQHILATGTLKGAITAGEKERVALAESLERLRLSKVIEALRRVNSKEDFNGALEDLINRLGEISGIVNSIDGVTMRNMLPLDVDAFLEELRDMNEVWQKYDDTPIELATLRQELKEVCEKMREMDRNLRSLIVQDRIANAL